MDAANVLGRFDLIAEYAADLAAIGLDARQSPRDDDRQAVPIAEAPRREPIATRQTRRHVA